MDNELIQERLLDLFIDAKNNFDFWCGMIKQYGYNNDAGVSLSMYYGQMSGIALAEKELVGDGKVSEIFKEIEDAKLYEEDYKSPE